MTAALEGGEWSAARPGRTLTPGNTRYSFYRRLGGPQGRSGRAENLVPTGIRSRTIQPVAQSLYRLSYPAGTHTQILPYCQLATDTALWFVGWLVYISYLNVVRSQWLRGIWSGSAVSRLLVLWVRIPPGARMFVSCDCRALSGRGLYVGPITRPEESRRVWCVQWVWS